jgi:hypothetical protein
MDAALCGTRYREAHGNYPNIDYCPERYPRARPRWGTGLPMGVKGAGLANSISVMALAGYSHRVNRYLSFQMELMRPSLKQWRRLLEIGLPAGADVVVVFLSAAVVYYTIRDFGAAAQAGFGIGTGVLQTVLLPAMAIAIAAGESTIRIQGAREQSASALSQSFMPPSWRPVLVRFFIVGFRTRFFDSYRCMTDISAKKRCQNYYRLLAEKSALLNKARLN